MYREKQAGKIDDYCAGKQARLLAVPGKIEQA
jgi:hypothetical protein